MINGRSSGNYLFGGGLNNKYMLSIEIQRLTVACLILAKAIEDGRIIGVIADVDKALGFKTLGED